jgi:amino acid transporter
LTLLDIFMLGITGMIGSSWLFSALGASGVMGPASLLSWILAGLFFAIMVFGFAELGGLFPFSGSLARYNHYTHGTISNYMLAWAYFVGAVTTVSSEAVAVVEYGSYYMPWVTTVSSEAVAVVEYGSYYMPWAWNSKLGLLTPAGVALAAALILVFFALQLVGVHVFGWFNRVITAWKLIIPTLTFLLLLALYFHPSNVVGAPKGFFPFGTAAVFSGMITTGIVYAYEGFTQGLEYAGEARNPQRDVPLGTLLALVVTIVIYVLLQLAFLGGINWSAAGVPFGNWTALSQSSWGPHPFYSELVATGVPILAGFAVLLLIDAVVSPAGTLAAYVGTSGRNLYGMSRVGYIPKFFADIHEGFRTPWIALIVSTIIAVVFLLPFPTWYEIMSISALATVYNYLTVGVTNHALRRLAPDLKRSYRPPLWYTVYPASFIVAAMFVYWSGWSLVNVIIELVVVGLPLLVLGPYRGELKLSRSFAWSFAGIVWASSAAAIAAYYLKLNNMGLEGFAIYWTAISLIQVGSLATLWAASKGHPDVKGAVWLVIFNIVMGIISFIGSLGPLPEPIVPYPWDYLLAALVSLAVYFIGVYTAYETKDLRQIKEKGLPIE